MTDIQMGSFGLSGNCFYIAPMTQRVPTTVTSFPIIINPCRLMTIENNGDLFARDVNGKMIPRDLARVTQQSFSLDFYLSSIDNVLLQKLYTYYLARTKLWFIDGVGEGAKVSGTFRYYYDKDLKNSLADRYNMLTDADCVTDYLKIPYAICWLGYITNMAGDFYSSRKMNDTGSITVGVNGIIPCATHALNHESINFWAYWGVDATT